MACDLTEQTENEIFAYVKNRLGFPTVQVELTEDQLRAALLEALDWFYRFIEIGRLKEATLPVVTGQTEYAVAADVETVTQVWFDGKWIGSADEFGTYGPYPGLFMGMPGYSTYGWPSTGYSSVVQTMQYHDQGQRALGADADWWWNETTRKLILTPTQLSSGMLKYRYISTEFDYSRLTRYHLRLIRQRTYAEAMEILGRARQKYSELPSASGSFNLNGDTLTQDADMLRDKLDDEIRRLQRPLGFITG